MQAEIQDVCVNTVLKYVAKHEANDLDVWERVVLCKDTIVPMLVNGAYARDRTKHGLFVAGVMVGYAVVHAPLKVLDLLHLDPDHRGKGLGEWFLRQLDIEAVSVDPENVKAVQLYDKLGYELDFIKD